MNTNAKRAVWAAAAVVATVACFWAHARFAAVRKAASRKALCEQFGIATDGKSPFVALPPMLPHRLSAAKTGFDLFRDPRLAKSRDRMCVACHSPADGGSDGKVHGGILTRPSFNAVLASRFMHDGSATNIEAAVRRMIEDDAFCGAGSVSNAVGKIARDARLAARIENACGAKLSPEAVVYCLVQNLRTQISSNGPFDRFCSGLADAIPPAAAKGSETFVGLGCDRCHNGPAMGGHRVEKGRRVPALRGLSFRGPYMLDGSADTLEKAVEAMPRTQNLDGPAMAELVSFLKLL